MCPHCGGEMRIIAFITEAAVICEILGHLGEPTSPLWEMPGSEPFDPSTNSGQAKLRMIGSSNRSSEIRVPVVT